MPYTDEDRLIIRKKYKELLRKAKPNLKSGDDRGRIRKAFEFAAIAHEEQRRKTGEPYILHPIEVAIIVTDEIGLGATSIISALLHDVVEDTTFSLTDVEARFGEKVRIIIDGLTKISSSTEKTQSIQAENFRKMLVTISKDIRVVLIKIADRLHNMRTLDSMATHKQLKIKSETQFVYAPIAHRLGLYAIKSELEDLSLKFSDPESYAFIQRKLEQTRAMRRRFTRNFARPIEEGLNNLGLTYVIKSRTKSITSIYTKMQKQDIPFEEVYDLFAIRIIFDSDRENEKQNCWRIYSVVTDHYTPNIERLRDWISVPKSNGYESLHTTVMSAKGEWVEVQIRSNRMDEVAEKGYAAHWKYKGKTQKIETSLEEWLNAIRDTIENKDLDAMEFLEDFRSSLFKEEIFAFTPKGDLKRFPVGATMLDFAFSIHTEVGLRCIGAKSNGRLVSLREHIQNGDQIDILVSKEERVSNDWLSFVTTSKAKAGIKEALRKDRQRIGLIGREIVERKLRQIKYPFNQSTLGELLEYFNITTESELYYQIGSGAIEHTRIKRFRDFKEQKKAETKTATKSPETLKNFIEDTRPDDGELVIGDDLSEVQYSLAACCNPIPGEEIFGFITSNSGIKIHRRKCPNAVALMANYGYRILRAKWNTDVQREFEVTLHVKGTDRLGLVNDVTRVISNQLRVNIRSLEIKAENNIFQGDLDLVVHDLHEVQDLISKLQQVDGVLRVIRLGANADMLDPDLAGVM